MRQMLNPAHSTICSLMQSGLRKHIQVARHCCRLSECSACCLRVLDNLAELPGTVQVVHRDLKSANVLIARDLTGASQHHLGCV